MGLTKKLLCIIVILVFGIAGVATASAYTFQPDSSAMYSFAGNGNINWSGLFDSIERYKPGSHRELYTHSEDAVAGGTVLGGAANNGSFFAVQGLSLDSWGNFNAADQHINEKVLAVVAALGGFLGADRLDFGARSDRHLSFSTFGQESCVVPLPGSLWFLFSGLGMLGVVRRGWWCK